MASDIPVKKWSGYGGIITGLSVKLHFWCNIFTKISKQALSVLFSYDQAFGTFTGEVGGQQGGN